MLRKRSRAVTSKQAVVGDHNNLPWIPPEKPTKPTSFFFSSPRIFKGFLTICSPSSSSSEIESNNNNMSPTSILDAKPFSAIANSFWAENKKIPTTAKKTPNTLSGNMHSWEQPNNTKGIGVALVDENSENNNSNNPSAKQQKRKLVVFGSQLRIQVPPLPPSSVFPCFSPESPREFGIKTPRSNFRPFGNKGGQVHPQETNVKVEEVTDMEDSEDYTCVISHGPNPKTTHIFANCIVESCCGVNRLPSFSSRRNGHLSPLANSVPSPENFLSFCHHCKKQLGPGNDIYMYRGEKAFCSQECRCQGMLFDGMES